MNKRIIIPVILGVCAIIFMIIKCSGSHKIILECDEVPVSSYDSLIELKVYVENSGSMDAYMCSGSQLKDAVFDYVSDLQKESSVDSLFYVNSKIIHYEGELGAYIKDLTPTSFANAGGDRTHTNLPDIFELMMKHHSKNTVTVFVSDCILDLYEGTIDYLGNCQVSIKNTFANMLREFPDFGVEIFRLETKFDGFWYCGKNRERLFNVIRPYFIWVMGDKNILAKLNKMVPVDSIQGGIKNYCAFSNTTMIPFLIDKHTYVQNRTKKINVAVQFDMSSTLQSDLATKNMELYSTSNPSQASVLSVQNISNKKSKYSHVMNIEISNPETLKKISVSYNRTHLPVWVEKYNDSTGDSVLTNLDKTTGIYYLINGVAKAFKEYEKVKIAEFNLKNK